ncbi:hypothetical protein D3C85_1860050 [compost metagenome]
MEAVHGNVAETADPGSFDLCVKRMRGIVDDFQAVPVGYVLNSIHVARRSEYMHS